MLAQIVAECARLSKEIVALEAMAPSIAGSKRQVEAYRNLAEGINFFISNKDGPSKSLQRKPTDPGDLSSYILT